MTQNTGQPTGEAAVADDAGCACTLWAVVNAGGNLVRDFRATASANLAVGGYEVLFDTDVTACAYVATIGLPGTGNPPSGQISVATSSANPNGVRVDTTDAVGAPNNRPFHLAVHCAPGGGGGD
jgi:hypothetical protein